MTTMATRFSESLTKKKLSGEGDVGEGASEQRATQAGQRPREREGSDLLPRRRHRVGGGGRLVVAHRHDGAPHPAVPEAAAAPGGPAPGRRGPRSSTCAGPGRMRNAVCRGRTGRSAPSGESPAEERQEVEVLLGRQGEDEGDDGQIQAVDPQRAEPDAPTASRAEATVVVDDGQPERDAVVDQAGGEQGPEPGEGHLPERQLAQPSGEHGQRRGADGEGQHLGEELLA